MHIAKNSKKNLITLSEVFDIFMRVKHRKYFEMLKKAILFDVDSKVHLKRFLQFLILLILILIS